MGSHPVNLVLRFLLELVALLAAGLWGWDQAEDGWRYLLAIGLPVILATLWRTFAVPNDPSRSGKAPVVTNGIVRLLLELAFFGFAAWAFYSLGFITLNYVFVAVVIVHYLVSYDRVLWLLKV